MKSIRKLNVVAVIVSTALSSAGQIFFKYGVLHLSALWIYITSGVFLYIVSTVIYLYVLSRESLSWTYGLGGLGYIFAVVLAVFFLPEGASLLMLNTDSILRWMGVIVIAIGVIAIGMS